jgi:REP element-mobilizing transposase RayT
MSHLRCIAQSDRIFFITTCLSQTVPRLRSAEMDTLLTLLDAVRHSSKFLLLGYVLMPDHAHLLIATPTESISHILHQWKFRSGHAIQNARNHSGRFWQPRYFDFICRHSPRRLRQTFLHAPKPGCGDSRNSPRRLEMVQRLLLSPKRLISDQARHDGFLRRSRRTPLARPQPPPVTAL